MTPVQMFRDRWECGHIGTVIFAVQAILLVPYIIIGVMGGGTTLAALSRRAGAVLGRRRAGRAGRHELRVLRRHARHRLGEHAADADVPGLRPARDGGRRRRHGRLRPRVLRDARRSGASAPLLTRERVSPWYFFSYTFIPLSSIAFPHIGIFCLTAKKLSHFKRTVVLYPICMLAIWLPCVFLGVAANRATDVPAIKAKLDARAALAAAGPALDAAERDRLRRAASGDDVMLRLVEHYAPVWLVGLLGAVVMAAVMASDSQILALSTMFTEDVFTFYGGTARFGPNVQVQMGRLFVVLLTLVAYAIALRRAAVDLRSRQPVRLRRLLGAGAAAGRRRCSGGGAPSGARWRS